MRLLKYILFNIPRASVQLLLIILLGAGGLLLTLSYLTGDIKMTTHSRKTWIVRDSTIAKNPVVDVMTATIHPRNLSHTQTAPNSKGDVSWNFKKLYMTYNPPLLVWMALISVMVGGSLAVLPVIYSLIADIKKEFSQINRTHIGVAVVVAILIGCCIELTIKNPYVLMLFDIMAKGGILLNHPYYLNYTIFLCLFSGLVAIVGQLVINFAVSFMPDTIQNDTKKNKLKVAEKFNLLKNNLKFFLMTDAVLVVFSIITTDTLRRAVNQELSVETTDKNYQLIPHAFVYLYGMVFTLYLGLLYLPVYYLLQTKGDIIAKGLQGKGDDTLTAVFQLKESPVENLKVALSVLAPAISSLLPAIIK